MKNVFFALLGLVIATETMAHPKETDSLSKVGVGSTITILTDINVPPGERVINFKADRYRNSFKECFIRFTQFAEFDRVLPAGRVLNIKKVKLNFFFNKEDPRRWDRPKIENSVSIYFKDEPEIEDMQCAGMRYSHDGYFLYQSDITLEDARRVLDTHMQIDLATPVKI